MATPKKLTGAEREAQLLDAGAKLASKYGAQNVTRRMVAKAARCAEGLVNRYMGDTATAQRKYAKQAKKIGLSLPTKDQAEAFGLKLRKHKPKDARDTRKRSVKEVKAITGKKATGVLVDEPIPRRTSAQGRRLFKPMTPPETKPTGPANTPKLPSPALPLPKAPEAKSNALPSPLLAPIL